MTIAEIQLSEHICSQMLPDDMICGKMSSTNNDCWGTWLIYLKPRQLASAIFIEYWSVRDWITPLATTPRPILSTQTTAVWKASDSKAPARRKEFLGFSSCKMALLSSLMGKKKADAPKEKGEKGSNPDFVISSPQTFRKVRLVTGFPSLLMLSTHREFMWTVTL